MPSILVVDDDLDTCRNMADLLGDQGYVVDVADGGDLALQKAGQQPYDLGLLDLRLPGMDGLTLGRHLKRLHPRMVTMIITAYGSGSLGDSARDAGVRYILPKPIDFPRLMVLIEQALPCAN
jgi:CheY-like chemotaxis protein